MLSFAGSLRVFVALEPCDMRKGYEGLAALVSEVLREDVRSGALFVFGNRRHTRLKILYFDGSGIWVMGNRHAPQCAYRFVFKNPLSISSALRERLRVFRIGWRQEGHGLRAACRSLVTRGACVDVRSRGLFRSESG